MARLQFDQPGKKEYSVGVKNGVLFTAYNGVAEEHTRKSFYNEGVAWNGLTAITETPGGAEANDNYADDIKYISLRGAETFNQTIEAFMAPDEWATCDGFRSGDDSLKGILQIGQQERSMFGTAHIVTKGNDIHKNDYGFEIHLAYNMTASPSEKAHNTINENPELTTNSWECTADPVAVDGGDLVGITKPTANIVITATIGNNILKPKETGGWDWNTATDSSTATTINKIAANVKAVYELIFGRDGDEGPNPTVREVRPTLPQPGTIYSILKSDTIVDAADYAIPAGV